MARRKVRPFPRVAFRSTNRTLGKALRGFEL
jgi:hypothetical protein